MQKVVLLGLCRHIAVVSIPLMLIFIPDALLPEALCSSSSQNSRYASLLQITADIRVKYSRYAMRKYIYM